MSKLIDNLLRELKEGKAVYGSKIALKKIRDGKIEKIYITNDCPKEVEEKIKESKVKIFELDITKEMLKELCKTPFNVSVVSILSEEKLREEQNKEDSKKPEKQSKEMKEKKK